jgi:hypothetical protein
MTCTVREVGTRTVRPTGRSVCHRPFLRLRSARHRLFDQPRRDGYRVTLISIAWPF